MKTGINDPCIYLQGARYTTGRPCGKWDQVHLTDEVTGKTLIF